jgi:tripartite-type tricarboxylate transporter receptor subunit TctC
LGRLTMQLGAVRRLILQAAFFIIAASANPVFAQDYPNRPVRIIVPYSAGGGTDITMRVVQEKMSSLLGQQMVIDNRAGGGTLIGTKVVEKATADGYTIGAMDPAFIINPSISSSADYDPLKNFEPVSLVSVTPLIMVVPLTTPFHTLKELIDYAKANPGKLTYASPGIGSGGHMAMEQFCNAFKLKIVHVPYRGSGPGIVALLGGETNMLMAGSGITPHVQQGRLRALAVTGTRRLPALPDVPTFTELGYPHINVQTFAGVVVPAGTSKAIIDKLHDAVAEAVRTPAVKARLEEYNQFPIGNTPDEFRKFLQDSMTDLKTIAHDSKIKID